MTYQRPHHLAAARAPPFTLADAAAAYATAGVAVFPVCQAESAPSLCMASTTPALDPDQVARGGAGSGREHRHPHRDLGRCPRCRCARGGHRVPDPAHPAQQGLIGGWGQAVRSPIGRSAPLLPGRPCATCCRRGREGERMWIFGVPADTSSPRPPRSPLTEATAAMR